MIVACTTDRRFVQLAGVMLVSLFDRGDIGDWRVVVFGYRLRPRDKAKLRQACGAHAERIEFIDVEPDTPDLKRRLPTRFALSPAPYLRLLIPAMLGDAAGRVLYLDADTLILSSLQPLAELDMRGCALAAVQDHESTHPSKDGRLSFPAERPYFNSGVLLIDLERWRGEDMTARAFRFVEAHEDELKFPDQDTLNCIVDEKWLRLDPEWNFTHQHVQAAGGYRHAHIVHFTGGKPWSGDCRHPARELFLQYRSATPWRHKRLTTRFERRIGKSLRKRLTRLKRLWAQTLGRGAARGRASP